MRSSFLFPHETDNAWKDKYITDIHRWIQMTGWVEIEWGYKTDYVCILNTLIHFVWIYIDYYLNITLTYTYIYIYLSLCYIYTFFWYVYIYIYHAYSMHIYLYNWHVIHTITYVYITSIFTHTHNFHIVTLQWCLSFPTGYYRVSTLTVVLSLTNMTPVVSRRWTCWSNAYWMYMDPLGSWRQAWLAMKRENSDKKLSQTFPLFFWGFTYLNPISHIFHLPPTK